MVCDPIRTGTYCQHGGFTGEWILEECTFLSYRRKFA